MNDCRTPSFFASSFWQAHPVAFSTRAYASEKVSESKFAFWLMPSFLHLDAAWLGNIAGMFFANSISRPNNISEPAFESIAPKSYSVIFTFRASYFTFLSLAVIVEKGHGYLSLLAAYTGQGRSGCGAKAFGCFTVPFSHPVLARIFNHPSKTVHIVHAQNELE